MYQYCDEQGNLYTIEEELALMHYENAIKNHLHPSAKLTQHVSEILNKNRPNMYTQMRKRYNNIRPYYLPLK